MALVRINRVKELISSGRNKSLILSAVCRATHWLIVSTLRLRLTDIINGLETALVIRGDQSEKTGLEMIVPLPP